MSEPTSPWTRFWRAGTWWKALLAVAGYLAIFQGGSLLIGRALGSWVTGDSVFDSPTNVIVLLVLPQLFGAAALTAFMLSLHWWARVFRQPLAGPRWMWVVVVLVLLPISLRLAGIDYAAYAPGVVPLALVAGLGIGFTEELLYRGVVVRLLRDAGHGERVVAVVSSALFALSHTINLAQGQSLLTVALTVVFTFGFGMLMYLVLRATGNLVWPMLVHALTDPTTFLASGGIDAGSGMTAHPLLAVAGPFNIVFVLAALVAIPLISNVRASSPASPE